MTTVHIRKQGGAAIITIPVYVLKTLHLEIGEELELDITKQGFLVKPVTHCERKRYGLAMLLKGTTTKNMKALNDATQWAREGKAKGREIA